nr:zinc finger, CCHC-type, retrotransposon Gag domain protein [Tanacetum cinerariifolium]
WSRWSRFLWLTGFVGKKAGPPEKQAKHFKWALSDWILDGIVNTEFMDMVNTRQSTLEFFGLAFDEAVQRAVNALLPGLTAQITNELCQNGAGSNVLGCADEFKARLASYKFKGDTLNWWKASKQAKGGKAYVATLSWKEFCEAFFLQYFSRFVQQKYEREYHTIRQKDGELT